MKILGLDILSDALTIGLCNLDEDNILIDIFEYKDWRDLYEKLSLIINNFDEVVLYYDDACNRRVFQALFLMTKREAIIELILLMNNKKINKMTSSEINWILFNGSIPGTSKLGKRLRKIYSEAIGREHTYFDEMQKVFPWAVAEAFRRKLTMDCTEENEEDNWKSDE